MKIRSIICLVLLSFILTAFCACSAKPIDREKITEYNEQQEYDSFYAHENIYYDLDDDFDLAFTHIIAVYDPKKTLLVLI
jgi:hypothetical protein